MNFRPSITFRIQKLNHSSHFIIGWPNFLNTVNDNAPFLCPAENEEPILNEHASFQVPLLKWVKLTFSGCVGYLPAFKWMNDDLRQSPLISCWCWHPSQQFFSRLPTCSISADSPPSANGRIMQSFILENFFQQSDRFHFQFFKFHSPRVTLAESRVVGTRLYLDTSHRNRNSSVWTFLSW